MKIQKLNRRILCVTSSLPRLPDAVELPEFGVGLCDENGSLASASEATHELYQVRIAPGPKGIQTRMRERTK